MKKTIVFCLFCGIFTLISASVCLAQDWGTPTLDDLFNFNDLDAEDSFATPEPSFNDDFSGSADVFAAEPAAPVAPVAPAAPASDHSAASAVEAAAAATAAAATATAAAEAASAAAAAAAAAADSVSAAASAGVPQSAAQQPPVRIVIPMMATPPAQQAPPQPPAYRPPSPPPPPLPPPAQPAPPMYRQPPITIIPAMPNPYSPGLYRVQLGAFSSNGLAQQCFSRLLSAGFSPSYEPYSNVTRVVLPGIRAADMALIVERLAAAGFNEAWIREER